MRHAENFVHTGGNCVNGSGAANFIFKFWTEFFAPSDDLLTFFAVGVPGVFCFCAGFLSESGEGNLGKAIFDDFIASDKFVFFPVAKFFSGLLDGGSDFSNLFVGERITIDLLPVFFLDIVAIVLGALCDE